MADGVTKRIDDLELSNRIKSRLKEASVKIIQDLTSLTEREVRAIKGIGEKSIEEIRSVLSDFGRNFKYDRYGKRTCARHNRKRTDARLRGYFLCEECAKDFQTLALHDKEPELKLNFGDNSYYCSHCNKKRQISLYQWYVCDICDRVLRSIGRGLAASKGVFNWWEKEGKNRFNWLEIEERDQPILRSIHSDSDEENLDFVWKHNNDVAFGAEIKTGRNHLKGGTIGGGMSQFQLDISDIQAILLAMKTNGDYIPSYLFHCQVVDVPEPPTTVYECVGIWWTSIDTLIEDISDVRQRPRENRPAAYIERYTFEIIDTFPEEIESVGYADCPPPSDLEEVLENKCN